MLICPHCDKLLDQKHLADGCSRRFTRRFFFGALAGLAASVALPDIWAKEWILQVGDVISIDFSSGPMPPLFGSLTLQTTDYWKRNFVYEKPIHGGTNFIADRPYKLLKAEAVIGHNDASLGAASIIDVTDTVKRVPPRIEMIVTQPEA